MVTGETSLKAPAYPEITPANQSENRCPACVLAADYDPAAALSRKFSQVPRQSTPEPQCVVSYAFFHDQYLW
jgi:hypothetical protein